MNYFAIIIYVVLGFSLLVGVLLGLMRGSRRSLLRLCLIALCIVLALSLRSFVTDMIFQINMDVNGTTMTLGDYLNEIIANSLPEEVQSLGDTVIVPLTKALMGVLVFLVLFIVLQFFTWVIVFPICKIFVKPKKKTDADGNVVSNGRGKPVRKKNALLGGGIGLVQGVIVMLCVCIPLAGLFFQANKIVAISNELQETTQEEQSTALDLQNDAVFALAGDLSGSSDGTEESSSSTTGSATEPTPSSDGESMDELLAQLMDELPAQLSDFSESSVGKFFGETCKPLFNLISSVSVSSTDDDGEAKTYTITLAGQIETVEKLLPLAKKLMSSGSDNALQKINDQFAQLSDAISNCESSEEVLEELKKLNEDGSAIKELFAELDQTTEELTEEQKETVNTVISAMVDSLADSTEDEQAQAIVETFKETLKETDLTDVKFTEELDVIDSIVTIVGVATSSSEASDEEVKQQVAEAINSLSDSTLILPILENITEDSTMMTLSDSEKETINEVLSDLPEDTDQETVDKIKAMLGLTESSSENSDDSTEEEQTSENAD